jgi:hypothetical protein
MCLQNITNLKKSVFKFLDTYKQIFGNSNLINIINSFIQSNVIDISILSKYNYCEDTVDEQDTPYFTKIVFDGSNESVVLYVHNDVYYKILFEYLLANTQSHDDVETNVDVIDDILNENENLDIDFDTLLRKMLIDGYKQIKSSGGFIDSVNINTMDNINESETYNETYNFSNSDDVFDYLEKINNQNSNHN